jgi:hypothetical protein
MSCYQMQGKMIRDVKLANRRFEDVPQCEELVKRSLKSGDFCYDSVQIILSSRLMYRKEKYYFVCDCVWVWNLFSDIKEGT